MNSAESSPVKDVTDDQFMVEVIEKSKELPVLVDFWAPWCGPCKSLTPILESVSAKKQSSIALVKVNIDENKMIASQLRVQSIPAVFAFSDGQPVDGFMGAKTESEVKDFIDNIINKYSKNEGSALENAKNLIESEEYDNAKLLLENFLLFMLPTKFVYFTKYGIETSKKNHFLIPNSFINLIHSSSTPSVLMFKIKVAFL